MEKVIPILRVSDYDKAIAFYVKWLGYKIDWEKKPEEGAFRIQLSLRGHITFQLAQYSNQEGVGSWMLVENFEKLIPFRKILSMKPGSFPTPKLRHLPEDQSMLSVIIRDPFKNLIELRQQN